MHRVFLSHAARDKESWAFVREVEDELSNRGCEVFEYKRRENERGPAWRLAILTAAVGCDVALLLEDRRSHTRKWVRYERAIFDARSTTPFGACPAVAIDL